VNWRLLAAVAPATFVSHAFSRQTYGLLLAAMEEDVVGSHTLAGSLGTINYAGYLVGVALMAIVAGRFEPIYLLRRGLGAAAVGFLVLAFAPGFALLAFGLVLAGLGSAAIWMSIPAIATAGVPASQRGTIMGALSSTIGLGLLFTGQGTTLIRTLLDDQTAWRPIWSAEALITAVILVIVLIFAKPPPSEPLGAGVSVTVLRSVPGWFQLTVAYVMFGMIVSGTYSFLGAAIEDKGFSPQRAAATYSLLGLSAIFAAVTMGRVSDRVGRVPVLVGSALVMGVAPWGVLIGRDPWLTMAALAYGGASFTYPVLTGAYLRDQVDGRAFTAAFGSITIFYGMGAVIGPQVGGLVRDVAGTFDPIFITLSFAAFGAAGLCATLPRRSAVSHEARDRVG